MTIYSNSNGLFRYRTELFDHMLNLLLLLNAWRVTFSSPVMSMV
jgi:hypothetical protein